MGPGANDTILTTQVCSHLNHRGSAAAQQIKCPPCHHLASSPWPRWHSCHLEMSCLALASSLAWAMWGHHCIHSTSHWAPEQHSTPQLWAGHSLLFCSKAPSAAQNRSASVGLFPYKHLLIGGPQVESGNEEPLGWWTSLPGSLPDGLSDERGGEVKNFRRIRECK